MTIGFSIFADLSTSAGLIVSLLTADFLLSILLDINKLFYIKKLVTSADNTTITKTLKNTTRIVMVFFLSLDIT